jgi:hypothetical protein
VVSEHNKTKYLSYLKEIIQRDIIELHSVRQEVKCKSKAKVCKVQFVCHKKKYMELEMVDFIKLFSALLRKIGHTQTWYKTMSYKNCMVFTFGVFHIHENRV